MSKLSFLVLSLFVFNSTSALADVHLSGHIDYGSVSTAIKQIKAESRSNGGRPVKLYINSLGGHVAGEELYYEFVTHSSIQVHTYLLAGTKASSAAAAIFTMGDKRFMSPDSYLLFHPAKNRARQQIDMEVTMMMMKSHYKLHMSRQQMIKVLYKDFKGDRVMGGNEAVKLGIAERV